MQCHGIADKKHLETLNPAGWLYITKQVKMTILLLFRNDVNVLLMVQRGKLYNIM